MGKLKMTAKVVSQETLATDVYSLVLEAPEIASQAIAGQFERCFYKVLEKIFLFLCKKIAIRLHS